MDIKGAVSEFRQAKLWGKKFFSTPQKPHRDLAFNREEAAKILRYAVDSPSYKALAVALLITTGLRVGELLALREEDVCLDDGFIWVARAEDTRTRQIGEPKEGKHREVYLSSEARSVAVACLEWRQKDESSLGFLFLNPNSSDGKMHLRALDDFLREHIHKDVLGYGSKREARSPHDCRRTYASLEYANGTPIGMIQLQLGHERPSQTEEYIKNVASSEERRLKLCGCGLLSP